MPKISVDDPLHGVLTYEDVGIDVATGRPKISKEVFDEMRNYLSVQDPSEKQARIIRVRKSVWDLKDDPVGQKSLLHLETSTIVTNDINKGKGIVYDFEAHEHGGQSGEKLMA